MVPAAVIGVVLLVVLVAVLLLRGRGKGASGTAAAPVKGSVPPTDESHILDGRPRVTVLYGTQTGTAERFSKQLANELRHKYGASTAVDVKDVENYKAEEKLSQEKLVILCMATYGDGEPTDNAAMFYTWLAKEADAVEAGEREPFLEVRPLQRQGLAGAPH